MGGRGRVVKPAIRSIGETNRAVAVADSAVMDVAAKALGDGDVFAVATATDEVMHWWIARSAFCRQFPRDIIA